MCNVPGWVQCYKIGLKRYGDEAKAVAYADSVIRQTQSASTIADLSTFERSGPIGQLTTMFYSWFRVMYQMQNEAIMRVKYEHGINRVKDLASYAFYILVAQSVAEALLRVSDQCSQKQPCTINIPRKVLKRIRKHRKMQPPRYEDSRAQGQSQKPDQGNGEEV